MITFNTQEEFDAAVMTVVESYLKIAVFVSGTPHYKEVIVALESEQNGIFHKDKDNG